jgi:hypothetical protein
METFFNDSADLGHRVLRPLSHIKSNWELTWDSEMKEYIIEEDSFAEKLNDLISEIDIAIPPAKYHDKEDALAEYVRDTLNWPINKVGNRWICADYNSLIEQGGFSDTDQTNLILAASGRIHTSISHGQHHFDEMEEGHKKMLAAVLSTILYHRC